MVHMNLHSIQNKSSSLFLSLSMFLECSKIWRIFQPHALIKRFLQKILYVIIYDLVTHVDTTRRCAYANGLIYFIRLFLNPMIFCCGLKKNSRPHVAYLNRTCPSTRIRQVSGFTLMPSSPL